jgi:UPF0755 protein
MDLHEYYTEKKKKRIHPFFALLLGVVLIALGALFFVYRILNTPPPNFPIATDITIQEGLTVSSIAEVLAEKNIVRSALYFYAVLLYEYKDVYVQAGTYSFKTPQTPFEIAHAITSGIGRAPLTSITLPEGFKVRDLTEYTKDTIPITSTEVFEAYEGYLFPDTYFISPSTTPEEFRTLLTNTFEERLRTYESAINNSGFTKAEVIILASLIEREAKDVTSKKIVSGILQNRLAADMPLQVDAVFDYILNKTSEELTLDDLDLDSPFNTYTHSGLPPSPISNPGIESIEAVLYPEKTEYLYYLTAPDGTFHYAKTFEQHKINKAKYLP